MRHSVSPLTRRYGRRRTARRGRAGFALVAALALLALSAALLIGALAISSAQLRSARSERLALESETRARYALAAVLSAWGHDIDSLQVGTGLERALSSAERGPDHGGIPSSGGLRVQRLAGGLWAVVVDMRVGAPPLVARQRLRLLVTRPAFAAAIDTVLGAPPETGAGTDSTAVQTHLRGPPTPISRWSVADLY
jgi:hypothetical protein